MTTPSQTVELRTQADADPRADGRARLVTRVLPAIGLLILLSSWGVSMQPGSTAAEVAMIAGCGLLMIGATMLFCRGRLAYGTVAMAGLVITGTVLVERILMLFLSGYFDTPERSLFMPVFSGLPALYLMTFVLLPVRRAERVAFCLWLPISLLVTALTIPYWGEPAKRSSLITVLSFLWLGHGAFLAMFSSSWRRQQRLIDRHAQMAAREREQRERASDSEARFRSLFDLAAVGINVTDAQGRYLMVNERMVAMLGYSREELLGMTFRDVTVSEDVEEGERMTRQVADGLLSSFRLEKRYRRKDGGIVHAEIFVRQLDGGPAAAQHFICVALDVTERKQVEMQAAEDRRIRDFHFENTPLAIIEFDADLRIRRWSRRAEKLFGWTEREALGCTAEMLGLVEAEQIAIRDERLRRMLSGEQDYLSARLPAVHRNGRRLWLEVYNSVTRDDDGNVRTLVSMALDVTESQDMLHMLNESEARFRSIFNQAAVGIALLDADGRWLNVNQRLCEITGYGMEALLEIDFQQITHPDDLERDLQMARAVMEGSIDHYEMEKRYIRADGKVTWIMLYVRRLDATGGTPARFISVVECIDERKAAEERVRALTVSLESRVAERTAQLRDIIQAGQRRNEELILITDMSRLLTAATNMQEAGQVVTRYLPRIFPLADGALYLAGNGKDRFERHAHWGEARVGAAVFESAECWAIRRGEPHHVEGEPDALRCGHAHPDSWKHPHLCIPIQALGTPLGMIELGWGRTTDGWAPEVPLIKTVAEKIGLSFGNLRLREELSRQALLDPLTGLNNRRWLDSALRMRMARHSRTGEGFAVLMIDVDHFKSINDVYGHEAGDRALQEIGGVLLHSVRDGEAAARFGGEEFTVLLDTDDAAEAQAAAERMRLAVTTLRIRTKDRNLPPLTVSIGVALYPMDGADAQEVLDRADEALYAGKRNGRNQVRLAVRGEAPKPVAALTP